MNPDFSQVGRSSDDDQANDNHSSQTKTPTSNTFQTPEETAKADHIKQLAEAVDTAPGNNRAPHTKWWHKLTLHWPPRQKELAVIGVVVILSGLGIASFITRQASQPAASVSIAPKRSVQPKTVPSILSGLPVDPALNNKPVTGIMIENSLQARPQAGLGQAGVVFEAIAEGGITRFLALFQDTSPGNVGPIRSARPYYAQWALGFDAAYAHVGGSPRALANIKEWGVKDLDQFRNSGAYHRIGSRPAPHNVYSSIAKLNELENSKGYTASKFSGFLRKKDAPSKIPDARVVNLAISSAHYNVHYEHDAANNSYKRSQGGAAHVDANTNTQISPKVVVAMVVPYGLESDGYHSVYNTLGSGTVFVFQDGKVTTGQWTKADNKSQIKFTDQNGKSIKFNPGQTWITAVGASNKVTYAP